MVGPHAEPVSVTTPAELSCADHAAWLALWRALPEPLRTPFAHPDFALEVGRVRNDARVAVLRNSHHVEGIFGFHKRPGGLARPLAAPFSDVHAPLLAPGSRHDVSTLLSAAGVSAYRFTGLPMDLVASEGAAHGVRSQCEAFQTRAEPGETGQDVLETLAARNKRYYKDLRRRERKIAREVGPLTLTIDDPDPVRLERLFALKSAQFAKSGRHDVLAAPWVRALMTSLHGRRAHDLRASLITLTAGGQPVAYEFNLRAGSVLHGWIVGYEPEFASYSPGTLLMNALIGQMHAAGVAIYDQGAGHARVKQPVSTHTVTLAEGLVCADGPSAWLHAAAHTVVRTTERRAPQPIASLVARTRRRADQIAACELDAVARARGALRALAGA